MLAPFIYTKILGWKNVGVIPKEIPKMVLIMAPHTSWQDFPIAILARATFGVPVNFIGKASLFKGPLGFIFRWLGGAPVNRDKSTNFVANIVRIFEEKKVFRLALSPEGTREKVTKWKTGFYYIAKGANVPIVLLTLDFGKKQVKASAPYYPTDDVEKDMAYFKEFYKDVQGKVPELF